MLFLVLQQIKCRITRDGLYNGLVFVCLCINLFEREERALFYQPRRDRAKQLQWHNHLHLQIYNRPHSPVWPSNSLLQSQPSQFHRLMGLKETFYLSHGSPMMSIDDSIQARQFFKSWKDSFYVIKPKAILCVSAHYDTTFPTVNVVSGPNDTIYDFYGFPSSMYKVISNILFFWAFLFFQIISSIDFVFGNCLISLSNYIFFLLAIPDFSLTFLFFLCFIINSCLCLSLCSDFSLPISIDTHTTYLINKWKTTVKVSGTGSSGAGEECERGSGKSRVRASRGGARTGIGPWCMGSFNVHVSRSRHPSMPTLSTITPKWNTSLQFGQSIGSP